MVKVGRGRVESALLAEAENWPIKLEFTNNRTSNNGLIVEVTNTQTGEVRKLSITPGNNRRAECDAVRSLRHMCRVVFQLDTIAYIQAAQRREDELNRFRKAQAARDAEAKRTVYEPVKAAETLAQKFRVSSALTQSEEPQMRDDDSQAKMDLDKAAETDDNTKQPRLYFVYREMVDAMWYLSHVTSLANSLANLDQRLMAYKEGWSDERVFDRLAERHPRLAEDKAAWLKRFTGWRKANVAKTQQEIDDEKERVKQFRNPQDDALIKKLSADNEAKDKQIEALMRRIERIEEHITKP